MIGRLVPPRAVVVEARDGNWDAPLLREEEPLVARAGAKRRREFVAGRACARQALASLGHPFFPLLKGADGAPIWPVGILGSITHCDGYCAAAAVRTSDVPRLHGLGIDAERNVALEDGVVELVCTVVERQRIGALPGGGALIFSAKESMYKAWYPVARRWLDYQDAEIEIDPGVDEGRFAVHVRDEVLTEDVAALSFSGRFFVTPTHLFTAVLAVR